MTNSDSIRSKIFEEGGEVWRGREKLSKESFSRPLQIASLSLEITARNSWRP